MHAPVRGAGRWRSLARARALQARRSSGAASLTTDLPNWTEPDPVWSTPQTWVVFSDLHVSPTSKDTALKVLDAVHEHAASRNAGVLFLGDFWHTRGSLHVPTLNATLCALRAWTQPLLMLVGNHDQVSLGGEEHALTPLSACSERVHVFERPTLWNGALWLPYRAGKEGLVSALEHARGQGSSTTPVHAMFAHADVRGACLNEAVRAREGLDPGCFPPGIPIYTGHYHKPHRVPGTNIHYVGSPYQGVRWGA